MRLACDYVQVAQCVGGNGLIALCSQQGGHAPHAGRLGRQPRCAAQRWRHARHGGRGAAARAEKARRAQHWRAGGGARRAAIAGRRAAGAAARGVSEARGVPKVARQAGVGVERRAGAKVAERARCALRRGAAQQQQQQQQRQRAGEQAGARGSGEARWHCWAETREPRQGRAHVAAGRVFPVWKIGGRGLGPRAPLWSRFPRLPRGRKKKGDMCQTARVLLGQGAPHRGGQGQSRSLRGKKGA